MRDAKRQDNSNVVRTALRPIMGAKKGKGATSSLLNCTFLHLYGRVATKGKCLKRLVAGNYYALYAYFVFNDLQARFPQRR